MRKGVWKVTVKDIFYKTAGEDKSSHVKIKSKKNKKVIIHTPSLDCGTYLRYIQKLLGHSHSKTKETYPHVSIKNLGKIIRPIDTLNLKGVKNENIWYTDRMKYSWRGNIFEINVDTLQNWHHIRIPGTDMNELYVMPCQVKILVMVK